MARKHYDLVGWSNRPARALALLFVLMWVLPALSASPRMPGLLSWLSATPVAAEAGDVDPSFGIDGRVISSFDLGTTAWRMAVQPDGKYLLAGLAKVGDNDAALARFHPNGEIDTSFGLGGIVVVDFGGQYSFFSDIAFQLDGQGKVEKIVAVGGHIGFGSPTVEWALARLDADGNLDPSFHDGGMWLLRPNGNGQATGVEVLDNGDIVVVGFARVGAADQFAMARLHAVDGGLDSDFGSGGLAFADVGGGQASSLALHADRAYLGGWSEGASDRDLTVLRMALSDGSLDTSFGTGGIASIDLGGVEYGNDLALETGPDGVLSILLAGSTTNTASSDAADTTDWAVARFGPDGSPLDSFMFGLNRRPDALWGVDVDSAGRVVVAGSLVDAQRTATCSPCMGVARLTSALELDPSFGDEDPDTETVFVGKGLFTTQYAQGYTVAVLSGDDASGQSQDDELIISGRGDNNIALVQLDADGVPDGDFGGRYGDPAGHVSQSLAISSVARDVLVQPDGKILQIGDVDVLNDDRFALARLSPSGVLDNPGFAFRGRGSYDLPGGEEFAAAAAVQRDGKIIAAGKYRGYDHPLERFALLRLSASGVPDASFGERGWVTTDFPGSAVITDLMLQDIEGQDRALAVGTANIVGSGRQVLLARYLSDGALDPGFAGAGKTAVDVDGGSQDEPSAIVPLPNDDRFLVAGSLRPAAGGPRDFFVQRYLRDGEVDLGYGDAGTGAVRVNLQSPGDLPEGSDDQAASMIVDHDGRAVVAGTSDGVVALLRLTPDGVPDSDFGASGVVTYAVPNLNSVTDLVEGPLGGYTVVGSVNNGQPPANDYDYLTLAFDEAGALDPVFGQRSFDIGPGDRAYAAAVHPDGESLLVGGTSFGLFKVDAPEPDADGDGVVDGGVAGDNCPLTPNPGQGDNDGDGIGDLCEQEAVIVVTSTAGSKAPEDDGVCTLREAIEASNRNQAYGGCRAGRVEERDVIQLQSGETYELSEADSVGSGLPVIRGALRIESVGGDQPATIRRQGGAPAFRILSVHSPGDIEIEGIALRNGNADAGGAIAGGGGTRVTLINSEVAENRANNGAGVYTSGHLVLRATTMVANVAEWNGGGIYQASRYGSKTLQITDGSRVASNSALRGGGIHLYGGFSFIKIADSDIVGNEARSGNGGGLYLRDASASGEISIQRVLMAENVATSRVVYVAYTCVNRNYWQTDRCYDQKTQEWVDEGSTYYKRIDYDGYGAAIYDYLPASPFAPKPLILTDSTISGNTARSGALYTAQYRPWRIERTTFANNTGHGLVVRGPTTVESSVLGPQATGRNCLGWLAASSFNVSSDNTCGGSNAPGTLLERDPLLAPLADNGGPTRTHALLPGSPAIDLLAAGGGCAATTRDQRGVERHGARCDAGAFELEGALATLSLQSVGSGSIESDRDGVGCQGGDCADSVSLVEGTGLTLKAEPDAGSSFVAWSGNCAGSEPVVSLTVDGAQSCVATFTEGILVTTEADVTLASDGLCSLREAVTAANTDLASGSVPGECSAGSGDDVIELGDGAYALQGWVTTDHGAFGLPSILGRLTIRGRGASVSRVVTESFGLFHVSGAANSLVLDGVTLRQGAAAGGTGAIQIYSGASVEMRRSQVLDSAGSGVTCDDSSLEVLESTIARSDGSGISGFACGVRVLRSTIDGNAGRGIDLQSSFGSSIRESTISRNLGGGIGLLQGGYLLHRSIVAENGDAPDCEMYFVAGASTSIVDEGFNVDGDGSCVSAPSSATGASGLIGPLTDNGGPTLTRALQLDGLAVDRVPAGEAGCNASGRDQRGVARLQDGDLDGEARCDAGALETGPLVAETIQDELAAGELLSTDDSGDGASLADPIETSVLAPAGGQVSIVENDTTAEEVPTGYQLLGQTVDIDAPASTDPTSPLELAFIVDASQLPASTTVDEVTVFRNNEAVPGCTGPEGVAEPDPCVSERSVLPDGDVRLTVLTTAASDWSLALAVTAADAGGPYRMAIGGSAILDGRASVGADGTSASIQLYEWDLDGDDVFAETGAGAERGDEIGSRPQILSLADDLPGVLSARLRVTDADGAQSEAVAFIELEEGDSDGDGAQDDLDNCPSVANPDQADLDADGQGDACDLDDDGDGVEDVADAFPADRTESADTDADGIGDNADRDDDGDGQRDDDELACGSDPLSAASLGPDADGDGRPDCIDPDDDNDVVEDLFDPFPFDPTEWADLDGDGIGDNADLDDDNDGQKDEDELACGSDPLDSSSLAPDANGNGIPDCVDPDADEDGVPDSDDNCPTTANPDQADADGDGKGDACDPAPVITDVTIPVAPVEVDTTISIEATFTDEDAATDSHAASIDWGDGASSGGSVNGLSLSASHAYDQPGIYLVSATVTDADGNQDAAAAEGFIVVYDPDGGFVTGGGWINSPAGAYAADPDLTGKATFGFVAKHQRGKSTPSGKTEFHFRAGDLKFKSSSDYMWLVVSGSGHKATYKGRGTVNGGGSYGFLVTAIDAANTNSTDDDLFRIKIWDKDDGDAVIYDNHCGNAGEDGDPCTALGGGNIKIHDS